MKQLELTDYKRPRPIDWRDFIQASDSQEVISTARMIFGPCEAAVRNTTLGACSC